MEATMYDDESLEWDEEYLEWDDVPGYIEPEPLDPWE